MTNSTTMTTSQRIGLAVFITAVVLTGIMFWMGANGIPLPKWVLALAAIL